MNKPKTHVAIILDKSGSMDKTKDSALMGFNEQIQQLKEDAKTQDILCSLVTFNGDVFEHLWNVPVSEISEIDAENYQPLGSTAMRDAVGYTVQKLLSTTDHEDPNTAYLVIVISDGDTNQDRHYTWSSLRELTQSCEATKKWTFTYMGCSKEYLEGLADQIGTSVGNMAAWSNATSDSAVLGFDHMRSRQKKYFAERAMGQTYCANYSTSSHTVADFCDNSVVEEAPAPVVVAACDMPKVDLKDVLSMQPKYTDISYKRENNLVFGNSQKVEWISR